MPKGPVLFRVWEHGLRSGQNWAAGVWAAKLLSGLFASLSDLRPAEEGYCIFKWGSQEFQSARDSCGGVRVGAEAESTGLLQGMGGVSTDHRIQG